jgi:ABC-type proline/glycine betaine transport system permease subunit
VPLSEDEQRILREIEQQFYDTDPAFARGVGTTSLYRHGLRRMKLAGLVFIVGLGVLVWMLVLGNSLAAFLLGAVPMFAAALIFEANLRTLGRAGIQQVTSSARAVGLRDALGKLSRRRGRPRRDGDADSTDE